MLYRIQIVTTEQVSVEVDSEDEARAKADAYVAERAKHHHHGEKVVAVVTPAASPNVLLFKQPP